jgi:hypothetical protein
MSTAPVPQPKQNQAVWWIVGIVLGSIAFLVFLAVVVSAIFIHRMRISESAKKVEISTPVGTLRVNKDEARSSGLPVYPGATPVKSDRANLEISILDRNRVGIAVEKYLSQDDLETISAWYAKRLGPAFRREDRGSIVEREDHHPHHSDASDADIAYVSEGSDNARVVGLKRTEDGVEISLVRAGKREVQ